MENVMALAGLAAVLALSLVLALGLEWLCLRGAFLLMPSPHARPHRRIAQRGGASEPGVDSRSAEGLAPAS
jgi:hypothetical protein